MYIVPSKYSDSEVDGVVKTVDGLLTKHEAKTLQTENLGKIKFAYPIKKFTHGTYILTYVEVDGQKIVDIEQELKLATEVLRHVIVKREEGIPTFDYKISSYIAPITPEGKRATQPEPAAAPKKVAAKKSEKTEEEPATSETVDEKLDDILDGDSVKEDNA